MKQVFEDVREDEDFGCGSWVGATEYVKANGGIVSGRLGDIKTFLKNGKLEHVVAIIKSCSPNALGDLKVTFKDLFVTLAGSIHYKKNMVKVFHKDFVPGNSSGVGGSEMNVIDQEDLYKFDKEALDLVLKEEARESKARKEWLEKSEGGGALGGNKAITHHVIAIFMYPLEAVEAAFALEVDTMGALDLVEVEAVGALDLVKVEAVGALDLMEVGAPSLPSILLHLLSLPHLPLNQPSLLSLLALLIQPPLLSLPPLATYIRENTNYQWEDLLDSDDSDLPLTPVLRPYNRHVRETITITSTQNTDGIVQVEEVEKKPVRIIPGRVGIVQLTKIRKQSDIHEGGDDSVLSTQEYMTQVVEDVREDEDFDSGSWVGTTEYVKANCGIVSGCLGDLKTFLKNGKLEQVVAIIKSCSPNALGDLKVPVKDLFVTLAGSIHYKVINEEGYEKEIIKNVVKDFHKDFVPGNSSGVGGNGMNVIDQEDLYKFDKEALDLVLKEEARE
uniref:Uncharacterized protein n=1 Tax=Tanacetum cinerariifolium TaxID=118510 RepID=A0A6L2N0C0_TANCI|nr:hypothetical protein [Tanacetum cinerariifolium]